LLSNSADDQHHEQRPATATAITTPLTTTTVSIGKEREGRSQGRKERNKEGREGSEARWWWVKGRMKGMKTTMKGRKA
jgi:hypothetical protein